MNVVELNLVPSYRAADLPSYEEIGGALMTAAEAVGLEKVALSLTGLDERQLDRQAA